MRLLSSFAVVIALGGVGCNKSSEGDRASTDQSAPSDASTTTVATAETGTDSSDADRKPASPRTNSKNPYRLLGILDPEREHMVAFALKVPSSWKAQQQFQRKWEGAVPLPQIAITLNAPDGRSQIVYFPSTQFVYGDGPMSNNLRAQKRSMGMPVQMSPNELAPMPPVAYIQNSIIPGLTQNGITLTDVGNPQTAPDKPGQNGAVESRGSIDCTLANGQRARIECRISYSSRQIGSDLWHSWTVVPSITQTADDLEAIHAHTRVAQDSIVVNPAWLQLERQVQAQGYQANQENSRRQHEVTMNQIHANTEAMTRGHNDRMAAIRQFGETNTARFNERMSTMDREQRVRVDTIRGESQYVNPTTGQRSKVEDGFNHVYTSDQHPNFFLGTDTPINPGELNWQELQKVQLKDY